MGEQLLTLFFSRLFPNTSQTIPDNYPGHPNSQIILGFHGSYPTKLIYPIYSGHSPVIPL